MGNMVPAQQGMSLDELKRSIMELHWAVRRELLPLENIAWSDARRLTSLQTMQMMKTLETFKSELLRHMKFAEVLVHPFLGQKRAEGLLRTHLSDQRVVERALDEALRAAGGELRSELAAIQKQLVQLFALERFLDPVVRR